MRIKMLFTAIFLLPLTAASTAFAGNTEIAPPPTEDERVRQIVEAVFRREAEDKEKRRKALAEAIRAERERRAREAAESSAP